MNVEIRNRPSFAHLAVRLEPGESLTAESGAMASMTSNTQLAARWNGGFFNALLRKFFGGESLFVNEVGCPPGGRPSEVVLTQATPGDMQEIRLNGTSMFVQKGSFVACGPGVDMGVGWAGIASWLGGEGLFRLRVSGRGSVWIGGYGSIVEREVRGELKVDSGHLIAYEPTIELRTGLSGGIFSSMFGGEGLVTRVTGQGRVYLQTRSLEGLASWTNRYLP